MNEINVLGAMSSIAPKTKLICFVYTEILMRNGEQQHLEERKED
jgi:hypothetical protein